MHHQGSLHVDEYLFFLATHAQSDDQLAAAYLLVTHCCSCRYCVADAVPWKVAMGPHSAVFGAHSEGAYCGQEPTPPPLFCLQRLPTIAKINNKLPKYSEKVQDEAGPAGHLKKQYAKVPPKLCAERETCHLSAVFEPVVIWFAAAVRYQCHVWDYASQQPFRGARSLQSFLCMQLGF